MRLLQEKTGRELVLNDPPLARGGESDVYALPGGEWVAKVCHRPDAEHGARLAAMLAAPPVAADRSAHLAIAWPADRLLAADGRVVGCLLPRARGALPAREVYDPAARRRNCPLFHHGYLLRTARNLAATLASLHRRGYVAGSLTDANVLVNSRALVTLIDTDSFQVPGPDRVFRCRGGRPEYAPPELQGALYSDLDRTVEHDAFALAVLIFQLLMEGLHPFAGTFTGEGEPDPVPFRIAAGMWPYARYRPGPFTTPPQAPPWDILTPAVQELFFRCFEDGHTRPESRPAPAAWQQALAEAEAMLTVCPVNPQHHHPRSLGACPWCDLVRRQGLDPFPPGPGQPQPSPRGADIGAAPGGRPEANPDTEDFSLPLLDEDFLPTVTPDAVPVRADVPPVRARKRPGCLLVPVVVGAVGMMGLVGVWLGMRVAGRIDPPASQPEGVARRAVQVVPPPGEDIRPVPPPADVQGPRRPPAPPPDPPADVQSPKLPPVPPPVPRGPSAEEAAWRQASSDLEAARARLRRLTRNYNETVQGYREGKVNLQDLLDQARALRAEVDTVRGKGNREKETWQAWQQAKEKVAAGP